MNRSYRCIIRGQWTDLIDVCIVRGQWKDLIDV